MTSSPIASAIARPARRLGRWASSVLGALILLLVVCEIAGWRFLRQPLERQATRSLGVPVKIEAPFSLHLLAPRLTVGRLSVGAPEGSGAPYLLDVTQLNLAWRWMDVWRYVKNGEIRVKRLEADHLDAHAIRHLTGPASWDFPALQGNTPREQDEVKKPFVLPQIDRLLIRQADAQVLDDVLKFQLKADASLCDTSPEACAAQKVPVGFSAQGEGTYQGNPVAIRFASPTPLALVDAESTLQAPLMVRIILGSAVGQFDGTVSDVMASQHLEGHVSVRGQSLAKIGEPFGLTLPASPPFRLQGHLSHDQKKWHMQLQTAQIGSSELHGQFTYDTAPAVPRLTGTVLSTGFTLADLGPAVGVPPSSQADSAPDTVLPSKEFDIPSLRRMNADVNFNFDRLMLGTGVLEALQPLKAHLVLDDAVLTLKDISAQTAGGRLTGETSLDSRTDLPQWRANLKVQGVDLAGWVKGARRDDAAVNARSSSKRLANAREDALKKDAPVRAYLTGELQGAVDLRGAGRSTAEILGSSSGTLRAFIREGTVSHLLMEAAGIDIAQALGVFIKGDNSLPMNCAAFDFVVNKGVAVVQRGAMDTQDSLVSVNGHTDLRRESMEFLVQVKPKDASLLTLRSSLHVVGTYAHPDLKLEKGSIAARLLAGLALAAVAPPAAIAPFIDLGESSESPCKRGASNSPAVAASARSTPAKTVSVDAAADTQPR